MNDFLDSQFEAKQHRAAAARVGQAAAEFRAMVHADEDRRRKETRERLLSRERTEKEIRREYAALGLEPPPGALVSLSFLLLSGWAIEYPNGAAALVRKNWVTPQQWSGVEGEGQQT